jgi:ABC-type multidrug transport system fused ATPase/permease subunit
MIEPYHYDRETNILVEVKWFVVSMCVVVMNALVIGVYLLQTMKTQEIILVGTISALFAYTSKIGSLFYYFAYRYGDIVRWRADVANAEELSDKFAKKEKNKQTILKKWKTLSIKNLSFKYEDEQGHALHLQDVSMTINRKERIALIGQSGSGKTTFLKIIRELYDPKNVKVSIDDTPLTKGFSRISNNISLIPQDPEIFSTTIKENITVGLPANMSKIKKYTNMAKFTEVALRLPKQWESSIVEKGVNLSGGEKQRLALSRGLFASENKEIILLDEPTSSVDAKNELEIYRNIFSGFKQKTIISSIHRLHLLPLFDTIYFFEKGKIIASGNYKELKQHCKKFQLLLQKYEKATK